MLKIDNVVSQVYKTYTQKLENQVAQLTKPTIEELNILMHNFIVAYELYQQQINMASSLYAIDSVDYKTIKAIFGKQINSVYDHFFKFQTAFNAYLGKKIVITYVTENRQIRIADNNLDNVIINPTFKYLSYYVNKNYAVLKNEEELDGLEITVEEATKRYKATKISKNFGLIFWRTHTNNFDGYASYSMGPINEAYVNFYVHQMNLEQGLEENIQTFVTEPNYGVIAADTANGFLIGDVEKNNISYAVKGWGGGLQHLKTIYEMVKTIKTLSPVEIETLTRRFVEQEMENKKSLIQQATQEQINQRLEQINKYLTSK